MQHPVTEFFEQFHIGAYFLQENARSDCHIQDLQACGIDLVLDIDQDREALDRLHRYGIAAVVTGVVPGWFGGAGENAGTLRETNPKEVYLRGVQGLEQHPAIVGVDIGDEPSSRDFPYLAEVVSWMEAWLPGRFPYLNLYPCYGMQGDSGVAQRAKALGQSTYRAYLEAYCRQVALPYLSFDHYVYTSRREDFLHDLWDAASLCRDYGKKLCVVLQVNSHQEMVFLQEEQLAFQGCCALAFGASMVSWACYSAGWWYNSVLDREGNKTQQYDKLKRVNGMLRRLTEAYAPYRWQDTQFLAEGVRADCGPLEGVTTSRNVLLGRFAGEQGQQAVFLAPMEEQMAGMTFCFRLPAHGRIRLYTGEGARELSPDSDGVYRVAIPGFGAGFLTVWASAGTGEKVPTNASEEVRMP